VKEREVEFVAQMRAQMKQEREKLEKEKEIIK
jgi:hypothetical protein